MSQDESASAHSPTHSTPCLSPTSLIHIGEIFGQKSYGYNAGPIEVSHHGWMWGIHCTQLIKHTIKGTTLALKSRPEVQNFGIDGTTKIIDVHKFKKELDTSNCKWGPWLHQYSYSMLLRHSVPSNLCLILVKRRKMNLPVNRTIVSTAAKVQIYIEKDVRLLWGCIITCNQIDAISAT